MMRMIMRLLVMNGLRHGIDWFFKKRGAAQSENLSPEELKAVRQQNAQQARTSKRSLRLLRRFMRF